jgi:hypothetical protein
VGVVDVATLKEQARGLEQKGKIADALTIYRKILAHLEGSSAILRELPLYVKAGDLNLKLGDEKTAIAMYERAAKRYAAYGSGKSVIALCKKILRVDATRSHEYLGLASRMIERGHLGEASKVLAGYADHTKLSKAKGVLEQLIDRPDSEVRPVLELMLEVAGRSEKERVESAEVGSLRAPRPDDMVPVIKSEPIEEGPAAATKAPAVKPVGEPDIGEEERLAVDHASASLDDSGSRPAVSSEPPAVRSSDQLAVDHASASLDDSGSRPAVSQEPPAASSGGELAVDHASASLDDSGSRPAIEPKGVIDRDGLGGMTVDLQSASLDDGGSRPAIKHGPPHVPQIPVAETSPPASDDVPADTLPWRIERQAETDHADEEHTAEPVLSTAVPSSPREPRRASQPRRALTLSTHKRHKPRGVRIALAATLLIVGGGAVLWFSDILPFGRGGSGGDGPGTAEPVAGDTASTAAPGDAAGGPLGPQQLEDIDSLARIALDSVAPPVVSVPLDSLTDTARPAVVPPTGSDTVPSVPQGAATQQVDSVGGVDSVLAVGGLAVQSVTQIETGGYVVAQMLDSGELLTLTVVPLGSDSADPTATGQVQVEFLGDTAVGRVLFGGYTVRASGVVTAETMERLLRQLVEVTPSLP